MIYVRHLAFNLGRTVRGTWGSCRGGGGGGRGGAGGGGGGGGGAAPAWQHRDAKRVFDTCCCVNCHAERSKSAHETKSRCFLGLSTVNLTPKKSCQLSTCFAVSETVLCVTRKACHGVTSRNCQLSETEKEKLKKTENRLGLKVCIFWSSRSPLREAI